MSYNTPPITLYPGEIQVLQSRPWKSTADFASDDFVLVTGPHAGQTYRHDLYPYGRWIMELWDMPSVRTVFIVAPSQTGKTTIAYACLCSEISRNPSSAGIGMPDQSTMIRIFDEKLGPHFKRSKALRELLSEDRQIALQNGKILTKFGAIYGMYAGSDASASSVTLRLLGVDEEDAYLDKQAAHRMLERTMSYEDEAKVLRFSKVRGNERQSTIWRDMKSEAQIIYQPRAACPNCGTLQLMDFKRIKVPGKMRDPKQILQQRAAYYECEGCAMRWNDHHRNLAVQRGDLYSEHEVPSPSAVGVIIPSWYSRTVSLSKVMSDFFTALERGTPADMQAFDNAHPSKPYQVVTFDTPEDQIKKMILHDRPPRIVPAEAVALTMGVDSQKSSYFFVVRAWARSGESWLIDYGELPNKEALDTQRTRSAYPVEGRDDVLMSIWRTAIDFGGTRDESHMEGWSRSEEVKLMVLEADDDNFFAVKGASRKQDVVVRRSETGVHRDVPREYQQNITIYTLDTIDLKDLIFLVRLRPDSLQPMWLHREVGDDYLRQLNSEKREVDGKGNATWVQKKAANHLLDCEVYAAACAHPDWTPALQLLAEPQYRSSTPQSHADPEPAVSMSPLSGRVINPNFRRF